MKDINLNNIPAEKFRFAEKTDFSHEKKLQTKPVGYFQDALRRFSKNKGAVVASGIIILLILFAIIVPFCTPYSVSYNDTYFSSTRPKNSWFKNTSFWDGCVEKETGKLSFMYYYAMGEETGHNAVKNQSYSVNDEGLYKYRLDTYHQIGMIYKNFEENEYKAIQEYQNQTGKQVIYPTLKLSDRPKAEQDSTDANYYYKTKGESKTQIVYEDGKVIPVYWAYVKDEASGDFEDPKDFYYSSRIAGDGYTKEGKTYYYAYARKTSSGFECRINYYEYYRYYHTQVLKDGITEPSFLFGTTGAGKDILTCLASGARFSFLFATVVAAVNLIIGAIWGSVAGYFGGKTDLIMERITDVLGAIPMMIVITLLKLHMGASSHALVLFLSFFLTGWIGMAGTTRMQFYRYKKQEYVLAARTLGANDFRLMFKHIFPNAIGTLVTACALVIPSMIYSETNLSYLGIINLETGNITSVGTLIAAGQATLATTPFVALFPSIFLVLMMLSFNLFGNGLRDAFNPSLRGSEE